MADIVSHLPTTDSSDGTAGSVAPTGAIQVGGTDGTNLRALSTNSSGVLNVDVLSTAPPNNLLATGTLTSLTSSVSLTLQGTASINVDVSGSGFVGNIQVEEVLPSGGRILGVFALNTSTVASSITANGNYRVVGLPTSSTITVIFSAYTSGSATINIYGSTAPYIVQPYSAQAANVLVTSYVNDGSGNSISSQSNALNVNTKTSLVYSAPITATVNTTSTLILAANSARLGLILSNTSSQQISFGFSGNAAAYQYGLTLYPGEKFQMDEYTFSTGAIYAVTTGATTYIGIQEIT